MPCHGWTFTRSAAAAVLLHRYAFHHRLEFDRHSLQLHRPGLASRLATAIAATAMQRVTGLPPGMRMLGGCVAPPHWSTTPAGCLAVGTSRQRMAGPDAMHAARMPISCSGIGVSSSCMGTGAAAGPSGPLFTHSSPSTSTAAAAGRAAAGGGIPLRGPLSVRPAMALMLYRQQRQGLVSSSGPHSTGEGDGRCSVEMHKVGMERQDKYCLLAQQQRRGLVSSSSGQHSSDARRGWGPKRW